MKWIRSKDRSPSIRGWYLGVISDDNKVKMHCRADNDTKTNPMRVVFFNGKKFPYDNHYHSVSFWLPLPELPNEFEYESKLC